VKRRRIDPRRAKLHRTYTVEEAARLFSVHRGTVRAWLRAGLKTVDDGRPALILGSELRRFHSERRAKRRCPTPAGMIYCLRCREPRRPAGETADYLPRTAATGDLQGICPKCSTMLYRRVSLAALDAVCAGLDVRIREGDPRITQCNEPSLNRDSTTQPFPNSNAQS
jgi:excisionase family DNA binding protein